MSRNIMSSALVAEHFAMGGRDARSHNGQLFVAGRVIFSYGAHHPLAMFSHITEDGRPVYVVNSVWPSVTTAKHRTLTLRALRATDRKVLIVDANGYTMASLMDALWSGGGKLKACVEVLMASTACEVTQ